MANGPSTGHCDKVANLSSEKTKNYSKMNQDKHTLFRAFLKLFRPMARLAIAANINCEQLSQLLRLAFCEVALVDHGVRRNRANVSRVAAMTGLSRKEVRNCRERLDSGDMFGGLKVGILDQVLEYWQSDEDYLEADGSPRTISVMGDNRSIEHICRNIVGDVPAGAVRTEMIRIGVVIENDDQTLRISRKSTLDPLTSGSLTVPP